MKPKLWAKKWEKNNQPLSSVVHPAQYTLYMYIYIRSACTSS